jgi:hypothetical protein
MAVRPGQSPIQPDVNISVFEAFNWRHGTQKHTEHAKTVD